MHTNNLKNMKRGWYIGNFKPTVFQTNDFEIAIQRYKSGDYEEPHTHKIAMEINVIISGSSKMNNKIYMKDSIIVLEPGEETDFEALTDVVVVVVKVPSVIGDKYKSDTSV